MNDETKNEDRTFEILSELIDEVFSTHYNKETTPKPAPQQEHSTAVYESIEDYTAQTGKRFRMTKRQKELGMTREEAFNLTYGEY